jgi:hypothetical protein
MVLYMQQKVQLLLFLKVTDKSFEFWELQITSMKLMVASKIPVGLVSTFCLGLRTGCHVV